MKDEGIKERIARIMKEEQLTPVQFAKETGIQQASVSHILTGRNNPSLKTLRKILQRFSYLNPDWLMDGIGDMISESKGYYPASLFDENVINPSQRTDDSKYGKEMSSNEGENTPKRPINERIRYIEKPNRKIVEIRIFYDDGTYETLIPQK